MPLAKSELKRLEAMLGIAQSTQHDGEAVNALRKAIALCATHKLSLFEAVRSVGTAQLDTQRLAALEADAYKRGMAAAADKAKEEIARAAIDAGVAYQRGYNDGKKTGGDEQAAWMAGYADGLVEGEQKEQRRALAARSMDHGQLRGAVPQDGTQAHPQATAAAPNWGSLSPRMAQIIPAWQSVAKALLADHAARLRPKDVDFLSSILRRGWSTLSEAQDNWLTDLARRCGIDYSGQGI